jgi:hypothetical protein
VLSSSVIIGAERRVLPLAALRTRRVDAPDRRGAVLISLNLCL